MRALQTLPRLLSITLSLHVEDQVDMIIKGLPNLETLNGLKVDREEEMSINTSEIFTPPILGGLSNSSYGMGEHHHQHYLMIDHGSRTIV